MMRTMGVVVFAVACGLLARCQAGVDEAVLQAETDRVAVIEKVSPSVLAVFGAGGGGGGSGVVISPDGYALSNFHVTAGAGTALKCGMADGELYDAVIVGIDPTGDVSLLKLFGRDDFPHATLGDSDEVRAGDWAYVMGNPFLLATDYRPTVTYGIISGVHRYQYPAGTILEYADCIQTDASINPGNSGGPLFNAEGELIGINGRGSFEKRGRVNVGVGYAISINQIKNFLGHLKAGRIVDHATLGAVVSSDPSGRVVVTNILEDSDAYRRGLRFGDEIVSFAGRPITTVNALKNALGIFPEGWRVPLAFRRKGTKYETLVRLRGVHHGPELWELAGQAPEMPPIPNPEDMPDDHPDGQPEGEPREGIPGIPGIPGHMQPRAARPTPEVVLEHFESRRGYANYYFNRLNRDRVWEALTASGKFDALAGEWTVRGRFDRGGGDVELRLDDLGAAARFPAGEVTLTQIGDLTTAVQPPGSGGMLAALYLWRRLLVLGPEEFGDLHYWGTAPIAGQDRLADVLIAQHAGVRCFVACDARDGQLLAVEAWLDENEDPCELYFSDYFEVSGRLLPGRLEVRHGDDLYAVFHWTDYDLKSTSE